VKRFKVGVSVSRGNGNEDTAETTVDLEEEDPKALNEVLWNLLDNLGVTSWCEEVRTVTVCAACHRAACWHGEFMCDEAKDAGTEERTVEELEALALESPHYWEESYGS